MARDDRGEIRLVDFDPAWGGGANKRRPAVVVSNDGANATTVRLGRGVITVVPLTSNVANVYDFQVLLTKGATGMDRDSKAQADQVRAVAVAVARVVARVGRLPAELMPALDEALRLPLAL